MKPRQYVHLLLILSEVIIIICLIIYIVAYHKRDWDQIIWIGSKILTAEKIMYDNNFKTYPILDLYLDGSEKVYKYNYSYLLEHSHKPCEENYKKCGILDTLGNIMCIPEKDECPINDVKIDLTSKYNEYISNQYKMAYLNKLNEGYSLYYTNKVTENNIIVKFKFVNSEGEKPRYINEDNFIFDDDTYKKSNYYLRKGGSSGGRSYSGGGGGGGYGGGGGGFGGGGGGGGGVGSGGGGFRNLMNYNLDEINEYKLKEYILEQFKEAINIDKSFNYVSNNLYVGNYIGFKDHSHLSNFVSTHKNLYTDFPDIGAYIASYFCMAVLIALIIYSLIRFFHEDKPNEGFNPQATLRAKLLIIVPYLLIFTGYFTHATIVLSEIQNKFLNKVKNIKADPFIETLFDEIIDISPFPILISFIVLFCLSFCAFVSAWILSTIFTKRYMKLLKNSGAKNFQH